MLLPTNQNEMKARGWREIDILLVTGDAYFDHPSHGAALIGRVLEKQGYRVGIIARPNWHSTDDFNVLGRPALFAGVTAGAVDSTLNNYTADLKRRRSDEYAPGGKGGGRPDLATLVYANRLKEAFPGLPLILGGIEASTRRFAYFEPLKKKIRRSVLVDTRAQLLVFGMGEGPIVEVAARIGRGESLEGIAGTARLTRDKTERRESDVYLPSFDDLVANQSLLVAQATSFESATRPGFSGRVIQKYNEGSVICESMWEPSEKELDAIYALPFTRQPHASYKEKIPAFEMIRWSVTSHRGCPGGCAFCALAMHQGRKVTRRSHKSILNEIERMVQMEGFKGTITDIGGPTANAYVALIVDQNKCNRCKRSSCLYPQICTNLAHDHGPLIHLLEKASAIKGVRHLFLASGVRHDLALKDPRFITVLAQKYTGGLLKVAPEHVALSTLKKMRKPSIEVVEEFERQFKEAGKRALKKQYLVPYFISGFPGCGPKEAEQARAWLQKRGQKLEQVQNYIPLPGTMAAAYYATGRDEKGNRLYVADDRERRRQKEMLLNPKSQ